MLAQSQVLGDLCRKGYWSLAMAVVVIASTCCMRDMRSFTSDFSFAFISVLSTLFFLSAPLNEEWNSCISSSCCKRFTHILAIASTIVATPVIISSHAWSITIYAALPLTFVVYVLQRLGDGCRVAPPQECASHYRLVRIHTTAVILSSYLLTTVVAASWDMSLSRISLIFVAGKFILDFLWDYYGYKTERRARWYLLRGEGHDSSDSEVSEAGGEGGLVWTAWDDSGYDEPNPPISQLDNQTPRLPHASPSEVDGESYYYNNTKFHKLLTMVVEADPFSHHQFPTLIAAKQRFPIKSILSILLQQLLVENIFRSFDVDLWLIKAIMQGGTYPTIWLVGILSMALENLPVSRFATNFLLSRMIQSSRVPSEVQLGAGVALAVSSGIVSANALAFHNSTTIDLTAVIWKQHRPCLPLMLVYIAFAVLSLEMAVSCGLIGICDMQQYSLA